MTKIYFHTNYPAGLVNALQLINSFDESNSFHIERVQTVERMSFDRSVIFLFDHSKKKIDYVTQAHRDAGYRVFAFKLRKEESLDLYKLALSLARVWPTILDTIVQEANPFVVTYDYKSKKLKKII